MADLGTELVTAAAAAGDPRAAVVAVLRVLANSELWMFDGYDRPDLTYLAYAIETQEAADV